MIDNNNVSAARHVVHTKHRHGHNYTAVTLRKCSISIPKQLAATPTSIAAAGKRVIAGVEPKRCG